MIEFGETLRKAREAKGMTVAQMAMATHMSPLTVEDIENENFERIPAPIYGRGFVKLYCEEAGLDPKPMIDEFMAIYNGDRDPVIHERIPTEPSPDEVATSAPIPEDMPCGREPSEISQADIFTTESEAKPCADLPSKASEPVIPGPPPAAAKQFTPPEHNPLPDFNRPRRFRIPWRTALLAIAMIAVLVVIVRGIRTLYHATSSSKPAAASAAEQKTSEKKPSTANREKRSAQSIPSLYID